MSTLARIAQLHRAMSEACDRAARDEEDREVYFVRAGDDGGPIKIGYATSPRVRVYDMQAGNHLQLHLLATVPGGPDVERAAHAAFAKLKIRGEWFRSESPLTGFIALLRKLGQEPGPSRDMVRAWAREAVGL